ncbi:MULTISPECIES: dipeptide ABC transporter ATP-binding protein [Primorskyibacter]|uniref:Peptide/nickel transport system ATP-binding protein n=1 Tax=Primorskyibacter flagellatus TaxID=1387277 RepID=A0A1W2EL34_9RHOB|nr:MULTISPECIES: ABC transporter ATP-binding protein [Primorskyibacter]SMD10355.1 peptide/nickel transport system ATP-binding protein [Primorskyibacter flagellatus]
MTHVLNIKDLTISLAGRPEFQLVSDINLTIARGETVALVGESGSGKSMTSLAVLGLLPPSTAIKSGEIAFASEQFGQLDLSQVPARRMNKLRGRELGMVFQEPMSAFSMVHKIGEQVGEPLTQHFRMKKPAVMAKAAELLDQVGIREPEIAVERYPFEFSGGMLQRAMIARAIACSPKLIIADEPTTALDVTIQAQVLRLLSQVQERVGAGMLFVTHDLAVAAQVSDRVLVMQNGRLVEAGTTRSTLRNPRHDYTKALVAAVPHMAVPGRVARDETTSHDPILTVRDVEVKYPGASSFTGKKAFPKRVLSNVSVTMQRGSIMGLVGESGSGKTTLARAVLGLVPTTKGEIEFHPSQGETQTITGLRPRALKQYWCKAQMVFQNPYASLNPWQTIEETLVEPIVQHGLARGAQARDRARAMLEKCEMPGDAMGRFPHAFSGGQRQRIAIARALVVAPELVVCDEPFSALDVSTQARIIALLKQLRAELDLSILLISHDLAVTSSLCDEVVVMEHGKVVEHGRSPEIFVSPKARYTANLIAAVPRLNPYETPASETAN